MLVYSSVRKVDTLRTECEKILFDTRAKDDSILVYCHPRFARVTAFSLVLKSTLSHLYRKLLFSVFVHFDTNARIVHCDTRR